MRMSRRQFNRGAATLTGAAAMPPVPVSMKRGSDDAYEAIVSELVRAEEAARAAGVVQPGGGAVSIVGRQLEGFIGHLDMKVSPLESSAQVYRELRGFLNEKSRKLADKALEKGKDALKSATDDREDDNAEEAYLADHVPSRETDRPENQS